jgi:hypothetical protein
MHICVQYREQRVDAVKLKIDVCVGRAGFIAILLPIFVQDIPLKPVALAGLKQ